MPGTEGQRGGERALERFAPAARAPTPPSSEAAEGQMHAPLLVTPPSMCPWQALLINLCPSTDPDLASESFSTQSPRPTAHQRQWQLLQSSSNSAPVPRCRAGRLKPWPWCPSWAPRPAPVITNTRGLSDCGALQYSLPVQTLHIITLPGTSQSRCLLGK